MNQREAKERGIEAGETAIAYCEVSYDDKKDANCYCLCEVNNDLIICSECLTAAAFESEMNARQFSPWEFLAHEINESGDRSEGLWDAYDEGVAAGIKRGMKSRLADQEELKASREFTRFEQMGERMSASLQPDPCDEGLPCSEHDALSASQEQPDEERLGNALALCGEEIFLDDAESNLSYDEQLSICNREHN